MLVAAATLTACSASSPQPSTTSTEAAASATDTPEQTSATTSPTPTVPPSIKTVDCHIWEFALPDDPEAVVGWKQQIPVDGGAREHAAGTVMVNDDGVPVAYLVAPDDYPSAISDRFCVNPAYLSVLNGVRRQGGQPLWAGDTLNLDAHTIFTVGDQNGVVYDNAPSSPLPPQH